MTVERDGRDCYTDTIKGQLRKLIEGQGDTMHNVIPFPKEEPAKPRPERLDLFDDIDASTGKPIFGLFVRMADGAWVDGEFYDSAADRDAAIPSWKADWDVDVVEVFWERKPS